MDSKWKILIMLYLCGGEDEEIHFKKLQRDVQVSAKVLTKELRELELNQLISRSVNDTRPISVKYAVTKYRRSVLPVAKMLIDWGMEHRATIKSAIKKRRRKKIRQRKSSPVKLKLGQTAGADPS